MATTIVEYSDKEFNEIIKMSKEDTTLNRQNILREIGDMYYSGENTEINTKRSLQLYTILYDDGYNDTKGLIEYKLAWLYTYGKGIDKEYDNAHIFFWTSSQKGFNKAFFQLGIFYHNGIGVERDYEKVYLHYMLAIGHGYKDIHGILSYNIGLLYEHGLYVSKNMDEAVEWYNKSSKKNNKKALRKLITIYKGLKNINGLVSALYKIIKLDILKNKNIQSYIIQMENVRHLINITNIKDIIMYLRTLVQLYIDKIITKDKLNSMYMNIVFNDERIVYDKDVIIQTYRWIKRDIIDMPRVKAKWEFIEWIYKNYEVSTKALIDQASKRSLIGLPMDNIMEYL